MMKLAQFCVSWASFFYALRYARMGCAEGKE